MSGTRAKAPSTPLPLYSSPVLTADGGRLPSRGAEVCRWIEAYVRLGPGDFYGEPFRLTSYQRRWIHRLYEFYPDTGLYRYKRALFGTAKGNGKTPFEAALGAVSLAGPTAPISPLVLVAASTKDQADWVFGDMREGLKHESCPLKPFIEPMQFSIQLKGQPGEAKRVAAVDGSNDGPRATVLLADELHEWTGRLENVFTILDGAIGKRRNAFTVGISTAGHDKDSLLGRMYERGKLVASGEVKDDGFLFEWYEAPPELEIPEVVTSAKDRKAWETAVLWANPALVEGGFLAWDYVRSRFDGAQAIERYKWERYHANRWTQTSERWLPAGAWRGLDRATVRKGERVLLAFCGTYDNDAAGLVGATSDGRVFVLKGWEGEVPRAEVERSVDEAFRDYRVERLVCDPLGWHTDVQAWAEQYGAQKVVIYDWQHQLKKVAEACSKFYTAVIGGKVRHDGSPALERHLDAAVVKDHKEGSYIAGRRGGTPVVLAKAAVMAFDVASGARKRSAYADHDVVTV